MNNKRYSLWIKVLLVLFISSSVFASDKDKMLSLYKSEKYMDACNIGYKTFNKHKKDEKFVTLYGFSCLKADYINRLAMPIAVLRLTKESRFNSAYFSVILMQKKLLYYAMIDGYDISTLRLPTSEHVLSRIFNMYIDAVKLGKKPPFDFQDPKDEKLDYKLYVDDSGTIPKVILQELYNDKVIKTHKYW